MSEKEKISELMSIEVLKNILGEEKIKEVAEESLKEHLSMYLRRPDNIDNYIYKISYKAMLQYIADECGHEMHKECAEAIRNTVNKEGGIAYYMFSDNKRGQEILNDEIDKARPYLRAAIEEAIDRYALKIDKDDLEEMIWEHITSKILGEKVEGEKWLESRAEAEGK